MDTKAIQKRIDAMPAKMAAKGLKRPDVDFILNSNAAASLTLGWKKPNGRSDWDKEYEWVKADTIPDLLSKAEEFIAALPSAEETRFNEFMGALGAVIDLGKTNGIEVEFLNPLVATMKKLSDNILTDQRVKL